ncbi:hypothetical protein TRFO_35042 [Tritrichomonas foetus]|uniref:RRM domain-containing protein n=1 Tax=Tritrichomonas foetus TaxID=1144522 RepID=A0A1J4JH84_9EUKA|nr:hypothetical protein TRFO_35042 [Tritrichomonas foetus]|eukprot:OHS98512.1 hypothetical protein TRFO_35042 [Tritrichomonas foetus]
MGYTPGLPPGIHVPHTREIQIVSNMFEAAGEIGQYLESPNAEIYNTKTVLVYNAPDDVPSITVGNYIVDSMISRNILSDPQNRPTVSSFTDMPVILMTFKTVEDAKNAAGLSLEISFHGNPLDIKMYKMRNELALPPFGVQSYHPRRVIVMNVDPDYIQRFPDFLYDHFDIDGYLVVKSMGDCVLFDVCPPIAPEAAALMIDGVQFGRFPIIARAYRLRLPRQTDQIGEFNILADGVDLQQILHPETKITTATDNIPGNGRFLYLLNVIPSASLLDVEESQILIYDIVNECKRFGEVKGCRVSNEKAVGACGKYGVAILEYVNEEGAKNAQEHIAGRRYLGRTIITMLRNE